MKILFPQCFQKACFLGASKDVIVWEWVNRSEKVKNAVYQHFLLFPQCPQKPPFPWLLEVGIVW